MYGGCSVLGPIAPLQTARLDFSVRFCARGQRKTEILLQPLGQAMEQDTLLVLVTLRARGRGSGKNSARGTGQWVQERSGLLLLWYLSVMATSPRDSAKDQMTFFFFFPETCRWPYFCPIVSTSGQFCQIASKPASSLHTLCSPQGTQSGPCLPPLTVFTPCAEWSIGTK